MWKSNDPLYHFSLSYAPEESERRILMVLFLYKIGSKVAGLLGVMAIREREKR